MTTPISSIIMPCYNGEAFIRPAIDSVLAQSYTNWELLIVDDLSADRSYEIAQQYAKTDSRIKVYQQISRSGPAEARNLGTQKATGRYIAFLDCDDIWHQDKLKTQISFMIQHNYALTYTSYQTIDEQGEILSVPFAIPNQVGYADLLKTNSIGCLTGIYDSEQTGKINQRNLNGPEDYVMWLEILKQGFIALGIDLPLAYYRIRANSRSSNKLKVAKGQWRVYRQIEKLPIWRSLYYFCHYACHGLRKYKKI